MSTIDKIISAGIELGEQIAGNISNWQAQEQTLRDQIAAALADARREGAEAMRAEIEAQEPVPGVVLSEYGPALVRIGKETAHAARRVYARPVPAQAVPTGERQAVLLTDEQILELEAGCGHARLHWDTRLSIVRAAELAVLAANNLEVRRG